MRLATREEIYSIDQAAAADYGLSSGILVEKAGQALAQRFVELVLQRKLDKAARIGVWCGVGNNGADGKVMARVLSENGYRVEVLEGSSWPPEKFEIIIDALFGVGLNRPIEGELNRQIHRLNESKKTVIAVDIPSGLDANAGLVLGACVKAKWTLTIAPAKPGLFLNHGPHYSGKIRSVDIGFPKELLKSKAQSVFLIGKESARQLLPSRSITLNKTSFGHLLVVAGSPGMEGAALLVSEAAARLGCGYVSLCSPSENILQRARPDFLHLTMNEFFKSDLKKYSAVVVGPGLGVNKQTLQILQHLLSTSAKVVMDADALTVLAQNKLSDLPKTWVLTPHAGELSRILGISSSELENDRLKSGQIAQKRLNTTVLFKGFRTVVACPGKSYIIGSGNVALAKAGAGDVLSGFIGSLMAQGLPPQRAAILGAFIHGQIADDWLRRGHSNRTLMASDLPELIDASLISLKKGQR